MQANQWLCDATKEEKFDDLEDVGKEDEEQEGTEI
jgi:hypothetical protein